MGAGEIITIILGFLGSSAVLTFAQFLLTRHDTKKNLTKEIMNRIDSLENKIDEGNAILARTHILRFSDELRNNITHSNEYFKQQIMDCDTYDKYCEAHPEFKNGLTEISSQYIKDTYKRLLEEQKI